MKNPIYYFFFFFSVFLINFSAHAMEEPMVNETVLAAPIHLFIKNNTKWNIMLNYIKNEGSNIRKIIASHDIVDLGLVSRIRTIKFFTFGKVYGAIAKEYTVPLQYILALYSNKSKRELQDKVLLISINTNYTNYFTHPSLVSFYMTLPTINLTPTIAYENIFPGLTTRGDLLSAIYPITPENDAFHRYVLGVTSDATKEELKEAYNGLINIWTQKQAILEDRLKKLPNNKPTQEELAAICRIIITINKAYKRLLSKVQPLAS